MREFVTLFILYILLKITPGSWLFFFLAIPGIIIAFAYLAICLIDRWINKGKQRFIINPGQPTLMPYDWEDDPPPGDAAKQPPKDPFLL